MLDKLTSLPLDQKIGQLFFIGTAGPELDDTTGQLLDETSPGGVCLFARNIREARQTRDLLDSIRSRLPIVPFLSVDQEGGLVDRLKRVLGPMPAASRITSPDEAAALADIIAGSLCQLGFNMDFAPVVDVVDGDRENYSNGLATRTFGRSREDVVEFAGRFLSRLQAGGITGCLKHFPGLAAARVDSHEELPCVDISESELESKDLFPYRALLASGDVRAVMIAHAAFPGHCLQETYQNGKLIPASLSYNFVTRLLRDGLGFDKLVITDDLEMGAIVKNYGIGDACKMAVSAGVDMLAICADPDAVREGHDSVFKAVESGEISTSRIDRSLERIAHAKSQLSEPTQFNAERLDKLSVEIIKQCSRLTR
jgi:beta-N-acetylhexosaminidase